MDSNEQAGISIGQLADCLQSEILNSSQKTEEIVDHLMVGAMCPDPSPLYFGQKSNKAVITRSDRTDIQLGALETSIKCLILTGGQKPGPIVLSRAEEKAVPILLVKKDTPSTLLDLEEAFGQLVDDEETLPKQEEPSESG